MKRIEDFDFEKLWADIRTVDSEGNKVVSKPTSTQYKSVCANLKYDNPVFLEHSVPYLAAIPRVSSKPSECLKALNSGGYVEVNGAKYPNSQLRALILLISNINRGDLMKGKQTANPRFAALTPMVMFAMKSYHKIPYSYWQESDECMVYFLGRQLYDAISKLPEKDKIPSMPNILKFRNEFIAAKGAQSWDANGVSMWAQRAGIGSIPMFVRHMLFQTWVACEDLRDEEAMILDPYDFDNIPKPFATSRVTKEVKVKRYEPIDTCF
jgi:hypothetical protein